MVKNKNLKKLASSATISSDKKNKKSKTKVKVKKDSVFSKVGRYLKDYKRHKFVLFLVMLMFIPVVMFFNNRYQDWNNARELRSIVGDFESLKTTLEQETGVPMELKKSCFTTQEKFSSGKTACYLEILPSEPVDYEEMRSLINKEMVFRDIESFENNVGSYYYYNSLKCSLAETPYANWNIGLSCPIAVRSANESLRKELFEQ